VDLLGELLALLLQAIDLVGDVDRRVLMDVAQLVDLALELGNRLLEVEEGLLHRSVGCARGRREGGILAQLRANRIPRASRCGKRAVIVVDHRPDAASPRAGCHPHRTARTPCESPAPCRNARAAAARRCAPQSPDTTRRRARAPRASPRDPAPCAETSRWSARGRSMAPRTCDRVRSD